MKRPLTNRASVTLALGVEYARKMAGMSKAELAKDAGCTPQYITSIEERLANPRQELIAEIANALGLTPSA